MTSAPPSPLPHVTLVRATQHPVDLAVAAARTCYSDRVVTPEEVADAPDQRARVARATFQAGHHTVFQHAHFTFAMGQVSRQVVWSFLHGHPFYNSEQVSQRYVSVKPGRFAVPDLPPEARATFLDAVTDMHATYQALVEDLRAPVSRALSGRAGKSRRDPALADREVRKKAQEIARYALPVATHAHLYHTVSALTLFRYARLRNQLDVPAEARAVVDAMVREVTALDPDVLRDVPDAVPLQETLECQVLSSLVPAADRAGHGGAFSRAFDQALGGRSSLLVGWTQDPVAVVGESTREVLGLLPGELGNPEAVACVLDPAQDAYLAQTLNLTPQAKLSRALEHVTFTFRKRLSHTADSQEQRHRTTGASRPVLSHQVDLGRVDVVVPPIMERHGQAAERFLAGMGRTWEAMRRLAEMGVGAEAWSYLLPNAFPVRYTATGNLLHLRHKWVTRLCWNAQEEIWRAAREEVAQVRERFPLLGAWLVAPCGVRARAGVSPRCPEGDHFCGVPVWKTPLGEQDRDI